MSPRSNRPARPSGRSCRCAAQIVNDPAARAGLLTERIRHSRRDEVAFLILMVLAAVFVIDLISQRRRILRIEGRKALLIG